MSLARPPEDARPPVRSTVDRSLSVARFVLVGTLAAFVHWTTVRLVVPAWGWAPALANVAGFALAFGVSYLGHHRYSFRSQRGHRHALPRFLVIACAGFAINETAYVLLLRHSALPYDVLLAAVLVAVAGLTYVASRLWAFSDRHDAPGAAAPTGLGP